MNTTTLTRASALGGILGSCLLLPSLAGASEGLARAQSTAVSQESLERSSPIAPLRVAQAGEEDEARARSLFENGARLYEEGRYEEAILAWEEGYRLSKRPLFLFNIANAQERLGKLEEALSSLNRYRAFAADDEREVLEKRVRNLEQRVKASASTAPPGAGSSPASGGSAGSGGSSTAAGANPSAVPGGPTTLPAATSKQNRPSSPLLLPGVLMGAGLVGLGSGAASGLTAVRLQGELEASCVQQERGWLCPSDTAELLAAEESQTRLSLVGYTAGAVLMTGGLVLGAWQLFLAPADSTRGKTAGLQVLPVIQPGLLAFSATTHF